MNWVKKFFGVNGESSDRNNVNKIDYVQITTNWNAHLVSPEIELQLQGLNLLMTIFVNAYVFDGFEEDDKANILFKNCSKYSLNICNDEGYYYGQYRTNPSELPWGEFYEIKNGLNREFPEPTIELTSENSNKRHFIFFFKDETFECLAEDFQVEFISKKTNT